MRVRIKTWVPAVSALAAGMAIASGAAAQCNSGCTPPPAPPTSCCEPPPAPEPPPTPDCCTPTPPGTPPGGWTPPGGHDDDDDGGNINIEVNVNNEANSSAVTRARAGLGARTLSGFGNRGGGGGSAYVSVDQPYPTVISGLNVEGGRVAQMVRTPYRASRWMEKRVVIQAFCIDDRNVPHPASQVRPDRDVDGGYDGELFRCIAGTRLQATIADYLGRVSFDNGAILSCAKGEALYYSRRGSRGASGYSASGYSYSESSSSGGSYSSGGSSSGYASGGYSSGGYAGGGHGGGHGGGSYSHGGGHSSGGYSSGGYASGGGSYSSSSYESGGYAEGGSVEESYSSGWGSFDGSGLECRPQKQERDCNERSLLRRYGAGVKILTLYREEWYTAYREEMVEQAGAVLQGGVISLDGGVGGRVF